MKTHLTEYQINLLNEFKSKVAKQIIKAPVGLGKTKVNNTTKKGQRRKQ